MESLPKAKPMLRPLLPVEYNPWMARENDGKILFIGGIPLDSNYCEVFEFLGKFDTVKWLKVETDEFDRPKGYAYALLATDEGYHRVLSLPCWKLRDVPVGVKIWKDPKKYLLEKDELQRRKVFVKRLSPYTTEKTMLRYFSQFGELERVDLRRNHEDNTSRRIGFVTFMTTEAAEKCLETTPHLLDGSAICCRKSKNVAETKKEKSFVSSSKIISASFQSKNLLNLSQRIISHDLTDHSRCSETLRVDQLDNSLSLTKENLHFLVSDHSINPEPNESRYSSNLEHSSQEQSKNNCLPMTVAMEPNRANRLESLAPWSPTLHFKASELQETSNQFSTKVNKTFSSMESSSGMANCIQSAGSRQVNIFFFVFPGYI